LDAKATANWELVLAPTAFADTRSTQATVLVSGGVLKRTQRLAHY